MVNIAIPEWGIVLSLLAFAVMLAGAAGAVYSRIGKLEGSIAGKLNGTFTDLCKDMGHVKTEIAVMKTDVSVLRMDMGVLRTDLTSVKPDIIDLKLKLVELSNK